MYSMKFVIGDWSGDGHGSNDVYVIESNYSMERLQEAYLDSCKKTGWQFHSRNTNICGEITNHVVVLDTYQDNKLYDEFFEDLDFHGANGAGIDFFEEHRECETDESVYMTSEMCFTVLMIFIGISMPSDWTHRVSTDNIPVFNIGGRCSTFIGYACFDF